MFTMRNLNLITAQSWTYEWLCARWSKVTFSAKFFFPSKVPEFLHVLLN